MDSPRGKLTGGDRAPKDPRRAQTFPTRLDFGHRPPNAGDRVVPGGSSARRVANESWKVYGRHGWRTGCTSAAIWSAALAAADRIDAALLAPVLRFARDDERRSDERRDEERHDEERRDEESDGERRGEERRDEESDEERRSEERRDDERRDDDEEDGALTWRSWR